jgi:putative membrane protein
MLPGLSIDNYFSALLVAIVLAFLNTFIKPILTILTIPITVVTLGLFLLAINAFLVIIAGRLVSGFHVSGFWWALFFGLVLSIYNSLLDMLLGKRSEE